MRPSWTRLGAPVKSSNMADWTRRALEAPRTCVHVRRRWERGEAPEGVSVVVFMNESGTLTHPSKVLGESTRGGNLSRL